MKLVYDILTKVLFLQSYKKTVWKHCCGQRSELKREHKCDEQLKRKNATQLKSEPKSPLLKK